MNVAAIRAYISEFSPLAARRFATRLPLIAWTSRLSGAGRSPGDDGN
jgi:hypothetical protein